MTDSNDTYATRPVARFDDLDPDHRVRGELQIPPATGWVVHQILSTRSGLPTLWAWCRVSEDAPGYTEVVYTHNDGVTLADPGTNPQLGPVVFKAFC